MYSRHAITRCQQRGIRTEIVETLLSFGTSRHAGGGAETYFMDNRARARAERALGRDGYARIADRLNAYVIVAEDGTIVTAAKRTRRLRRH